MSELEIIAAESAMAAEELAMAEGWELTPGDRTIYWRTHGDGRKVCVRYYRHPAMLENVPQETPCHIGRFRHGMPASWAEAIRRFPRLQPVGGMMVGGTWPMHQAPKGEPILVYDAKRFGWRVCHWREPEGAFAGRWQIVGTAAWVSCPGGWRDLPAVPPAILIDEALATPQEKEPSQ